MFRLDTKRIHIGHLVDFLQKLIFFKGRRKQAWVSSRKKDKHEKAVHSLEVRGKNDYYMGSLVKWNKC